MFVSSAIQAAPGPTDDFWYGPINHTHAGAVVSAETAMRLSTVYKCVRVRAETIGMLPLQVYRRLPNGGKEADDSHPLASLLHDQPNPWQTAMQWRAMQQAHMDLRGNAYSRIVVNGAGRVDMLVPLHPDRIRIEVMPNGLPRYHCREPDGRERVYVFGELLHVATLCVDGYSGINPIEAEREAIGAAIATRDHGARFFRNSAKPPLWIKMPGKFPTPEDRRAWVQQFSESYGGTNSGKTPVMEQGMELQALPVSNVDAQYIESRKAQDIDIAGIFRMPPHKIGLLDGAKYANIEQQSIDFVTDAIMPSCVAWEQALLRDLDFGPDHFAEFKVSMLLRGDTKARYDAYGRGIQDGWLTRNEARRMENLNPLDGLDVPLEPMNMAPAGSRQDEDGTDRTERTEPDSNGGRKALMMAAAAERVARKEVAMLGRAARGQGDLLELFSGHAQFVASVMAVSLGAAEQHVAQTLDSARAWIAAGRVLDGDIFDIQTTALLRLEN